MFTKRWKVFISPSVKIWRKVFHNWDGRSTISNEFSPRNPPANIISDLMKQIPYCLDLSKGIPFDSNPILKRTDEAENGGSDEEIIITVEQKSGISFTEKTKESPPLPESFEHYFECEVFDDRFDIECFETEWSDVTVEFQIVDSKRENTTNLFYFRRKAVENLFQNPTEKPIVNYQPRGEAFFTTLCKFVGVRFDEQKDFI
jgi:hypothetical protein